MRIIFAILSFLFAFCGQQIGFAQEDRKPNTLLVKNMQDGTVFLKWVCEKVYYEEGFNVYRKTDIGAWEKLNKDPLLWNDTEIARISGIYPDVAMFNGIFQKITVKEFQENVASVFALQKAFQFNEFALAMAIGYVDKTASSGTSYSYKVVAIENGLETEMDQKQLTVGIYTPVQPPQNIVVERKKRKINFDFKPEPMRYFGIKVFRTGSDFSTDTLTGTDVYAVQQDIDENGKLVPWPKHLFIDRTINKEVEYTYEFFAVDYFAETSPSSGEIKSETIDFDPPQEAFGLDFTIDTQKVNLTWVTVVDPDRAGINVYRYNAEGKDSIKLNSEPLSRDALAITNQVEEFATYFYKVGVFDATGNEILSAPTMVQVRDIIPPLPPTGVKTTTDTGKVNLTWRPNKEPDLKGYVIFKVIDDGSNNEEEYTLVNPKPITATNYTETMSKNVKNTFHYVVTAVDTSWNYSKKSEYSVAELPDHVSPVKPFIKMVKQDDKSVVVEWIPNKDEDLKGYHMYRKTVGDSTQQPEKLNGRLLKLDKSTYDDKLFDPGTNYSYYMQAVDSSGNTSEFSNEFQIKTAGKSKKQAVNLSSFSVKKKRKGKMVSLKWVALPEENIEGYMLYRKLSSDKRFMPHTGQLSNSVFTDKKFEKGKTYEYQLRVYTKAGDVIRSEVKEIEIPADK